MTLRMHLLQVKSIIIRGSSEHVAAPFWRAMKFCLAVTTAVC